MRKCFLFVFLLMVTTSFAQNALTVGYVAAKSGLSMRDKPDAKATVLEKIPYGAKLTVNYEEIINISTEGMDGAWAKTTFNGKTGYIVNSYLLPVAPPKAGTKTMKDYLSQLSVPAGAPVIQKTGDANDPESFGSTLKKQIFKNGAEYHEEQFYESNNNNYFLPGFTIQQGFILVRLIPEFKNVFNDKDEFPTASKTFKKENREYAVKVEKDPDDAKWIEKISVDYEEGAVYHFSISVIGGQLMIVFGGGV